MPFDLLRPDEPRGEEHLRDRAVPRWSRLDDAAAFYRPSRALVAAVNVSLAVGAPLLVTGEPGVGKTALAWYVKRQFGLADDQLLQFSVKSTSTAEELLYTFDTVRYFHDAQEKGQLDKEKYVHPGVLWQAFELLRARRAAIVLVDEIDKAPRDFPNDLLHELDQFSFECRPLQRRIEGPKDVAPPFVIVTSNSERRLPEPFLRRCIFHHIEPDWQAVREAVAARMGAEEGARALGDAALDRMLEVRARNLRKPPSAGELFVWIEALRAHQDTAAAVLAAPLARLPHLGALVKDRDDLAKLA